jgi:hypothetical protein
MKFDTPEKATWSIKPNGHAAQACRPMRRQNNRAGHLAEWQLLGDPGTGSSRVPVGATGTVVKMQAAGIVPATYRALKLPSAARGHVSLREVERYTKAADQARLAREALRKVRPQSRGGG